MAICPLTGNEHRAFWMRSAWWCADCMQKLETCCEGACPSSVEAPADPPSPQVDTHAPPANTHAPAAG